MLQKMGYLALLVAVLGLGLTTGCESEDPAQTEAPGEVAPQDGEGELRGRGEGRGPQDGAGRGDGRGEGRGALDGAGRGEGLGEGRGARDGTGANNQ